MNLTQIWGIYLYVIFVVKILQGDLKRHIMTHESNPDLRSIFTCDICGKKSTCKGSLKRHIMTHESNPDLRYLFICDICGKNFTYKSDFGETHNDPWI